MTRPQEPLKPLTIRYTLTVEIYLQHLADHMMGDARTEDAKQYRKQRILLNIGFTFCANIIILMAPVLLERLDDMNLLITLCGIGSAIYLALTLPRAIPLAKNRRRLARETVAEHHDTLQPHQISPTTLTVDEHGIETRSVGLQRRVEWAYVVSTENTATALEIVLADGSALIIPRDQVDHKVLESICSHVQTKGGGDNTEQRMITQLLSERDRLCPRCSYQCRGVPDARCPECGRAITLNDFLLNHAEAGALFDKHIGK